jgi:pyruvate, water dikinase
MAIIDALRERVLAEAAARCDDTLTALAAAEDLEDLQRAMRGLETALDRDLRLIDDLGGDPDRLEQRLEPVLAAAGGRRTEMEEALRREVERALALPDESLRSRMGGVFRLLRRARAANLDPADVNRLQRRLAFELAEARARAGTHLVVPLLSGSPQERALVGGKAHALINLRDAVPEGCRVPRGFVVTTAAYRLHLLGETGEKLRLAAEAGDENAVSRRARAALLSGDVPDEVRDAIRAAYLALGTERCAVRSSATIEDGPLGSLAGLFDTYLGVTGLAELVDRIRWAWASLWNARALSTLTSSGLSPLHASQAVIVQEMIETKSAGVLFSRDPSGRPDALLINAAWGLGEGISQGEVAGDLYWVRRSTGELLASETGNASHRIELSPQGMGTVEAPLTAEQRGRACLTTEELARLATLARALEDVTGRAQDVEFGFDHEGGLVVFQMRRIVPRRSE